MAATSSSANYVGISVSSLQETMTEGTSDSFNVIPYSYYGSHMYMWTSNDDVTLDPSSFTFQQHDHDVGGRKITINVAHDDDDKHETVTIYFRWQNKKGRGDQDRVGVITRTLKVIDDDVIVGTIQVSPAATLTIDQGESGTFSVSLDTAPRESATVSLSKTSPFVTLRPSSLTFTSSNHSTAQRVTVIASEKGDATGDTITLAVSGGLEAPSVTKTVTIIPSIPSGVIQVTPAGTLSIDEGDSGTLLVSLSAAPRGAANVYLSSSNSDVTLSLVSLLFTPSNHSITQSVSVTAAQDSDAVNDSASITLEASGGIAASDVTRTVIVTDDDSSTSAALPGNIVFSPAGTLNMTEGGHERFDVGLESSSAPLENVTISFETTNADITITPSYLTFTPLNHSDMQSVLVSAKEDADFVDESALITATASGGIAASPMTKGVSIIDDDKAGHIDDLTLVIIPEGTVSDNGALLIDEEGEGNIGVRLSTRPSSDVSVLIRKTPDSDSGIDLSPVSMTFTPLNWSETQSVTVTAHADPDKEDSVHILTFDFEDGTINQEVIVKDDDKEDGDGSPLKTQALALPPSGSKDDVILRIQCKQENPCDVAFDCSAQSDGSLFEGNLPEAIPADGAISLTLKDIERLTGGNSWAEKGRLGCSLRSDAKIGSQVWTRSGDGVLVNNSAMIRSVMEGDIHRADIESIPSPDSSDESNIRIRCNSDSGQHCLDTVFLCYLDDGTRYAWEAGRIDRRTTRHLQSEELAAGIGYRWQGLGLACEVRSKGRFTAQVLTRTGTGALINNSATGE